MTKNVPTKSLLDAFPDWADGKGIFSEMDDLPWEDTIDADILDMDYFGNHSGWKKCSPLVYKLFDDQYELSDADREKLADLVTAKFLPNWTALWNSYHFEYDPLTDYDVLEEGERDGSYSKEKSLDHTGSKSEAISNTVNHGHTISEIGNTELDDDTTLTHGEHIDETVTLTHGEHIDDTDTKEASDQNSRYGFNSSDAVPVDERTANSEGTHSTVHSGDDETVSETSHSGNDITARDSTLDETKTTTHGGSDVTSGSNSISDTSSDDISDNGSDSEEYSKHFSGLKGYTSRQELIERERQLWNDSFFDKVYSDVDSVLASLIYKREHRPSPYAIFSFGYYSI